MQNLRSLILFTTILLLTSCALTGKQSDSVKKGYMVSHMQPDTVSVLHNPCNGWSIYTDGYIPSSAEDYYRQMEECGALAYASSLYIRLPWALLEPEEGKYAWLYNESFKNLIKGARDRNLKLAFRVYYDNRDYRIPVSPRYLIDAGAEGYLSNTNIWSPYADDPVFLSKLDKFLEAMGKEFNDPNITDYVDGCGLGTWGEGFNAVYKDKKNKDDVLFHVARSYARSFSKVIVAINAHDDIGNPQLSELAEKDDYVFRHDAIGSKVWFQDTQSKLMMDYFPQHFTIAESMWWLSQGPNTSLYTNEEFKDWREVMDFTFAESRRIRANILDLRNVAEASALWMKQAKDLVDAFNTQAGYRLTPVQVSYPKTIRGKKEVVLTHTWHNSGWGVCPNNNAHWAYKYKVAFALLPVGSDTPVETVIDNASDPSQWLKEKDITYTLSTRFQAKPGTYRLAIAIVDTTQGNEPGLQLAVSDKETVGKGWVCIDNVTLK